MLARQLRSPLLVLLAVTALASAFVGQASDAVIIGTILLASVGLGFVNEYKAEKTAEALHSSVRHRCLVLRDGHPRSTDVTELVPGDVVDLQLGQVVPADLRLLATAGLECDESVLTGESLPAEKSPEPVPAGTPLAELASSALMGTVVQAGSGTGVVVATGGQAEFGRIALGLGERQPETEFQAGLRKFSMLLVQVAGALTAAIFVINVTLHRRCSTRCCSRWPSRSAFRRSCSRRSSRPAWPPGHASWPAARSWSSAWSASRTSATSRCCSPTRPAR